MWIFCFLFVCLFVCFFLVEAFTDGIYVLGTDFNPSVLSAQPGCYGWLMLWTLNSVALCPQRSETSSRSVTLFSRDLIGQWLRFQTFWSLIWNRLGLQHKLQYRCSPVKRYLNKMKSVYSSVFIRFCFGFTWTTIWGREPRMPFDFQAL